MEMVERVGSWKDSNLQMKCAREAIKLIKHYIFLKDLLFKKSIVWYIIKVKSNEIMGRNVVLHLLKQIM